MITNCHPRRLFQSLDGLWEFRRVSADEHTDLTVSGTDHLAVPGVWETSFAHFEYRGLGLYARSFDLAEAGNFRLVFECVSHSATVWMDGQKLGSHYGAHTPFEFSCQLTAGHHCLHVLVDNRFGPENPLTRSRSDIYTYGGIVRSVWLQRLPAQGHFGSVRVLPRKSGEVWKLDLSIETRCVPPEGGVLRFLLDGDLLGEKDLNAFEGNVTFEVNEPELWSPDSPRLYDVEVEWLNRALVNVDAIVRRVGFRTIEVDGEHLCLNGQKLLLAGVNRHEFHPDFGPALPLGVQLRDMEILRKLGVNFVRVSHYPSDPDFLDLCDQCGILVWEELSHWQPTQADLVNPAFLSASLNELEEMVVRDLHHPSVIIWGMLNEADTACKAARPVVQALAERFRMLDGTRLVSYASNQHNDVCFDLVDFASRNLYPGWYDGRLDTVPDRVRAATERVRELAPGKPVLLAEFGAAASLGVRSFETRKWTEDYQAALLVSVIESAKSLGAAGVCIWQFCDVRTSSEHGLDRYREYNNKGLVTEYRQPKLAFEPVRAALAGFLKEPGR